MDKQTFFPLVFIILFTFAGVFLVLRCPDYSEAIQAIGAIGTFLGIIFLVKQIHEQRNAIVGEALSKLFATLFTSLSRRKRKYIFDQFRSDFSIEIERVYLELQGKYPQLAKYENWRSLNSKSNHEYQKLHSTIDFRNELGWVAHLSGGFPPRWIPAFAGKTETARLLSKHFTAPSSVGLRRRWRRESAAQMGLRDCVYTRRVSEPLSASPGTVVSAVTPPPIF